MNNVIKVKMEQFKRENHARNAWFTAEEWSKQLDMTITPQRLGAMYKAGLVTRRQDKAYWGDSKCRYDIKYKYGK